MKKFYFSGLVWFLIVVVFSCGTAPVRGQDPQDPSWEYRSIPILGENSRADDFPVMAINRVSSDQQFRSFFSGEVINNAFRPNEFAAFNSPMIIRVEETYSFYGEERDFGYYMLISGIRTTVPDGTVVEPGDTVGNFVGNNPSVIVFSETLDPYLVISSSVIPAFYKGYFWFAPTFLSDTGSTRFFSYDPVDDIDTVLIDIAEHMTESPGLGLFNTRVRFQSKLSEYPRAVTAEERNAIGVYERMTYGRTGVFTHVSEIKVGGYDYFLCWQTGFLDYLRREYTLNKDTWLYGVIVTYDAFSERGYIFLRDFSPWSVEEMYEGRLGLLIGG